MLEYFSLYPRTISNLKSIQLVSQVLSYYRDLFPNYSIYLGLGVLYPYK